MVRDLDVNGTGISVFFWPTNQNSAQIPEAVSALAAASSSSTPSTAPPFLITQDIISSWGTPQARFTRDEAACKLENFFGPHEIIFNTDLCGDWAGETFAYTAGCAKNVSCEQYVNGEWLLCVCAVSEEELS